MMVQSGMDFSFQTMKGKQVKVKIRTTTAETAKYASARGNMTGNKISMRAK